MNTVAKRIHIFDIMASFYMPECTENSEFLPLTESRHAIKSLRLRVGDEIQILNGKGGNFKAVIVNNEKDKVFFEIHSSNVIRSTVPRLDLAVSPLKFSDRFDFLIEKACEMGVRSITPLLCQRSERKKVKSERLQRIAISALKQSGNPYLTEIREACTVQSLLKSDIKGERLAAHLDKASATPLIKSEIGEEACVLIGPEGGFTDDEVKKMASAGFSFINLGPNVLRTESAALALSAYFHMLQHEA